MTVIINRAVVPSGRERRGIISSPVRSDRDFIFDGLFPSCKTQYLYPAPADNFQDHVLRIIDSFEGIFKIIIYIYMICKRDNSVNFSAARRPEIALKDTVMTIRYETVI